MDVLLERLNKLCSNRNVSISQSFLHNFFPETREKKIQPGSSPLHFCTAQSCAVAEEHSFKLFDVLVFQVTECRFAAEIRVFADFGVFRFTFFDE